MLQSSSYELAFCNFVMYKWRVRFKNRSMILNDDSTARSVEDETRNGHRNAKRNPNWNHETICLGLFSFENLKRAIKQ